MKNNLFIYNTLSRKKEKFEPINKNHVGMYVCGPTVYGEPHLGHARPAITFDLLFRLLQYMGYKVRYVRNITDVGHLVNDADEGEDKIEKKARLEELEPMEVVQHYTIAYHDSMRMLNTLPPSIEPRATGHIIEQIDLVKQILENGFGYEANGSIYFDVEKYSKTHDYGKLSGRKVEELLENTRTLSGQSEKKNNADFALWKKADKSHIMQWDSPWSRGIPGWHLECTAMSTKYLGNQFDIHGGGVDLKFPHHEAEIAQSVAALEKETVKYWMHNNLITIEGQKMGKSLGNFITLKEMFSGSHDKLEVSYSPMTIRFFILQAHYRSTLDFSNKALQASEKGLSRLLKGIESLDKIQSKEKTSFNLDELEENIFNALYDDLNSPIAISYLFEAVKIINSISDGKLTISEKDLSRLKTILHSVTFDILGLKNDLEETGQSANNEIDNILKILMELRSEAKARKDFETADKIRNQLKESGITVKDTKDGFEWEINK